MANLIVNGNFSTLQVAPWQVWGVHANYTPTAVNGYLDNWVNTLGGGVAYAAQTFTTTAAGVYVLSCRFWADRGKSFSIKILPELNRTFYAGAADTWYSYTTSVTLPAGVQRTLEFSHGDAYQSSARLDDVYLYDTAGLGLLATPMPASGGVELLATFEPTVTQITIGRHDPSGFVTLIRYGDRIPLNGGSVKVYDYEAPLDVPVYYTATQVSPAGPPVQTYDSNVVTMTSGGQSWLKDPGYPSLNMTIPIITSIETLTRPIRSGMFTIIDRPAPIVVTSRRQTPMGMLVMHTLTDAQRISLTDLLARGTTLLLQTAPEYGFGSRYVHIGDVTESRVGLAMEPARRWELPFTVVDRPEGLAINPSIAKTWGAVKTAYATWGDLAAAGKTWAQLLEEGP